MTIVVGILIQHYDRVTGVRQNQSGSQIAIAKLGAEDTALFLGALVYISHAPRSPKLLHSSSPSSSAGLYGWPSTRSRSSLPTLKKGIRLAATDTRAPLLGLRPCLARRCFTTKLPKPRISIRSPWARASTMESKIALIMTSESRRDR